MPYFSHNCHRLFFQERGSGPLLLILPGNTASSAVHQGELDYFSQQYRAISLDLRGTGRSERMTVWPDDWWEQGARDAAALIEHLGYRRCVVMGTSGGAVAALLMAALFPGRTRAVIADSCVAHQTPERLLAEVVARTQRTPEQVAFWQHAHGDDWQQVVNADSELLLELADRGGQLLDSRLERIRCPVLFTASLRDEVLPDVERQVRAMARQVADSRVFFSDEGTHPLMWSRPQEFRRAADRFLDRVAGGGDAGDGAYDPGDGSPA